MIETFFSYCFSHPKDDLCPEIMPNIQKLDQKKEKQLNGIKKSESFSRELSVRLANLGDSVQSYCNIEQMSDNYLMIQKTDSMTLNESNGFFAFGKESSGKVSLSKLNKIKNRLNQANLSKIKG